MLRNILFYVILYIYIGTKVLILLLVMRYIELIYAENIAFKIAIVVKIYNWLYIYLRVSGAHKKLENDWFEIVL